LNYGNAMVSKSGQGGSGKPASAGWA